MLEEVLIDFKLVSVTLKILKESLFFRQLAFKFT